MEVPVSAAQLTLVFAVAVDVLAAIDGRPVTLVGHSLGAAIAIMAAAAMMVGGIRRQPSAASSHHGRAQTGAADGAGADAAETTSCRPRRSTGITLGRSGRSAARSCHPPTSRITQSRE